MKNNKTLIVTGGRIELEFARAFLKENTFDLVIAADHGLLTVKELGIHPDIIVGDFDSIDPAVLIPYEKDQTTKIFKFRPEKDDTDTEIAIKQAIQANSTETAILGGTGSRIDHMISNIQLLLQFLPEDRKAYLIDKNNKIYLTRKNIVLSKKEMYGPYISLLPMSEEVQNVTLKGFKYPLCRHRLVQGGSIGISNEILEDTAEITFSEGTLLVIEARD